MEWNLRTLLILLVVLFVGYGIGLLEGWIRWRNKRHQPEKPAPQPKTSDSHPGESNLLNLWLDTDQRLRLDLEGQRLEAQGLTPTQRQRLIDLLVAMRPWVEGGEPAKRAPSKPKSATRPLEPQPTSTVSSSETPNKPTPAPPASSAEERPAGNSIVAQIDAILQTRLAGTPLSERGIRLQEAPEGGVIVYVGLDHYQSVDKVPYPEVQTAIRAAIEEWEDKLTPGL
jgi:hypothetical protein